MEGVQGAPRGGEGGRHGIESRSGSQSRAAGGEVRGGIERAAALDQEETCDEFSSNFFGRASIRYGVASEMLMWFARRKNRKQVGVGVAVKCVITVTKKAITVGCYSTVMRRCYGALELFGERQVGFEMSSRNGALPGCHYQMRYNR